MPGTGQQIYGRVIVRFTTGQRPWQAALQCIDTGPEPRLFQQSAARRAVAGRPEKAAGAPHGAPQSSQP